MKSKVRELITSISITCYLLTGGHVIWPSQRMNGRPEDDLYATPSGGAGVIGSVPGTSV